MAKFTVFYVESDLETWSVYAYAYNTPVLDMINHSAASNNVVYWIYYRL